MKVMTYNILTGGQDLPDAADSRLDLVIDVITAQAPDILVLQELNHAEQFGHRVLHRLENATGLRGFLATATTGFHVGVFVPKRATILQTRASDVEFHHAKLEVGVATSGGGSLRIVGTHLCPFGGDIRLAEAQRLGPYADARRMTLLMGDLNSLDPATEHSESLSRLPAHIRVRHQLADGKTTDTRAVATLLNAGFVDLYRRFSGEENAYSVPTVGFGGGDSGARIDYILASEPLAELATACSIVSGENADVASDHYPVVAELDLELR